MQFRSLLALLSVHQALAFPSGAGGCDAGNALGGFHLTRPQMTGDLATGEFEILLNDVVIPPETLGFFSPGNNNTITLRSTGADNVFLGFLLRLDYGVDDTMALIPGAESQVASVCTAQSVSSATHTDNDPKTEITATIDIDEDVGDVLSLQVTVVVANVETSSEWYVDQYMIQQTVGTEPPTQPPNPMFPSCSVCGDGMEITNADGMVTFPGQPVFDCATVQEAGELGFIDVIFCGNLLFFLDECACAAITPAPVTPAPVAPVAPITMAPVTPMPIVDTPSPSISCAITNEECRFNSDCCSNSCRAQPGQTEGVCVSTKTANKNAQKLGSGMGGAGARAKR